MIKAATLGLILGTLFSLCSFAEDQGFLEASREGSTLEYERVVVGDALKQKISWAILPYLKDIRYEVHVTINLKTRREADLEADNERQKQKRDQLTIDLGKLGTAAAPIREELITNLDLQKNISNIKIMLVFYDFVPSEKVDIIKTLSKKLVDIVPVWRLRVETLVPPPPAKPTKVDWVETYKWQIVSSVLAFLMLALIFVLGFRIRREAAYAESSHQAPQHSGFEAHRSKQEPEEQPASEGRVTWMNAEPVIEVNPNVLEAEMVEPEPGRAQARTVHAPVERIQLASYDDERAIYSKLAEQKNYQAIKEWAQKNFPAELFHRLSASLLKKALQGLTVSKRITLIASVPEPLKLALLDTMGPRGTKARDFAEMELSQAAPDKSGMVWKDFSTEVRSLASSHPPYKKEADEILRLWLFDKTKGKTGSDGSHAA